MNNFTVTADRSIDNQTHVSVKVQSTSAVPNTMLESEIRAAITAALSKESADSAEQATAPRVLNLDELHPDDAATARHFRYDHLPPHLAEVSRQFHDLAASMFDTLPPQSVELSQMIDYLLAAKDWAVRAAVSAHEDQAEPVASEEPALKLCVDDFKFATGGPVYPGVIRLFRSPSGR